MRDMSPISAKTVKSALLLIDIQNAFRVPNFWGGQRNNNLLEENVRNLIESTRQWNERQSSASQKPGEGSTSKTVDIIHVHHHSISPGFPLHPSFIMPLEMTNSAQSVPNKAESAQVDNVHGIDPLPCARVGEGEPVFTKHVNSAFIGTDLVRYLQENQIRQLFVFGITTDHCVSTSVRMAANLKVVDDPNGQEQGKIWIVEDACATFPRGNYSADLVHKLHIESLRDEFAGVTTVGEVLKHVLAE